MELSIVSTNDMVAVPGDRVGVGVRVRVRSRVRVRVRVRVSACADAEVVAIELVVVAREVLAHTREARIEFSHRSPLCGAGSSDLITDNEIAVTRLLQGPTHTEGCKHCTPSRRGRADMTNPDAAQGAGAIGTSARRLN